jgi:hypothetical protein
LGEDGEWKVGAGEGDPEETARRVFRESGFFVREPILFGNWCGREQATSFRDIMIMERAGS